jgi:hypothetical protein
MEKLPQQNQKEEININEKISEYKDFINSLREKYADLLDGSYSFSGTEGDNGFNGMIATVESAPTKPDRVNWGLDRGDTDRLGKIIGFINNNTKDNSKLGFIGYHVAGTHRLDEWLSACENGLDFLTSPENTHQA